MGESWKSDLERWLAPFTSALRHKTRARMCPAYVSGLIGAGARKSVQPMAARDGDIGYDQLHHFIASGVWDAAPLEKALLVEADKMVGGDDSWLIIDDTALPKKGAHSVGVAPQYASSIGKTANCQSLVSLTLASREVPVMVGLRLFLPESWTGNPARMRQARVPEDRQAALSKPEIAIEEIDRIIASGARFGCVLADSGYGSSGPSRRAVSARGLLWAVGLSRRQNVYPSEVSLVFPVAKVGKPRKYHIPDAPPVSAEAALSDAKMAKNHLAAGNKGPAHMSLCRASRSCRRWPQAPHARSSHATYAGRGGLARRRTPVDGRAKILRIQFTSQCEPQNARSCNQSQMGLRAGASAAQGRTRPRSLRSPVLDRPASTYLDDNDRLCLSPIPPPQSSGTKKKSRRAAAATEHARHPTGHP
jgi:hypothetical protein